MGRLAAIATPLVVLTLAIGAAGCGEPLSFVVEPSDYDQSCAVDADCVLIFSGELCECLRCKDAAINVAEQPRYSQTFREVTVECADITCGQSEAPGTDAGRVIECDNEAFCDAGTCAVRQAP